jgi:hypothetical protein
LSCSYRGREAAFATARITSITRSWLGEHRHVAAFKLIGSGAHALGHGAR